MLNHVYNRNELFSVLIFYFINCFNILDQVSLVTVLFLIAESELAALVEFVLKEVIRCHDVFGFHKNSKKSEEQLREEIKQELFKDEAVPESIGKVQLAYDYLINYINISEKDVLKAYDEKIRDSNNLHLQ